MVFGNPMVLKMQVFESIGEIIHTSKKLMTAALIP